MDPTTLHRLQLSPRMRRRTLPHFSGKSVSYSPSCSPDAEISYHWLESPSADLDVMSRCVPVLSRRGRKSKAFRGSRRDRFSPQLALGYSLLVPRIRPPSILLTFSTSSRPTQAPVFQTSQCSESIRRHCTAWSCHPDALPQLSERVRVLLAI
ncbi:hypothetical protein EXIGLDRAFT_88971 [Exidia glandulosa HHB12029]|uniref:Uncharacterized protein n=1 Tax=Exidia glandulosa HHB12029 TaxID=1314781 RepID=A0A165NUP7_EXIGL|nr:hypothetical protein EXIGLDRAFT_88971 [Exidia glandulosa HHB12029]